MLNKLKNLKLVAFVALFGISSVPQVAFSDSDGYPETIENCENECRDEYYGDIDKQTECIQGCL